MAIGKYLKEIGRGKDGARALTREQAADLMGQVLDGVASDLEIGAFCLAMRIKGETPEEMAGFLDATHARIRKVPDNGLTTVVIPSYNGARKLPLLTPLLAALLARQGLPVLIHGTATEDSRVFTDAVLAELGIAPHPANTPVTPGSVAFIPTATLCPGLQQLLEVRRVVNLRNSAHSLVKLMVPVAGRSLLVSSYTHPEYALSMAATLSLMQTNALLLRGTEGEAVADPRRTPKMHAFIAGTPLELNTHQSGTLLTVPDLPQHMDAPTTAHFIQEMLAGNTPVPEPITQQVAQLLRIYSLLQSDRAES
jgi:anthranilate phosphoribosyltransferase